MIALLAVVLLVRLAAIEGQDPINDAPTTTPFPTVTPFPTATPIPTITPIATFTPIPTEQIIETSRPTETPQSPPTVAPTGVPEASPQPTVGPTDAPEPTFSPTSSLPPTLFPTASPTLPPGTPVVDAIEGIAITYRNVSALAAVEFFTWATVTGDWFNRFYAERSGLGVRDMESVFTLNRQSPNTDGSLTVLYTQRLSYVALAGANTTQFYALLPFNDFFYMEQHGDDLRRTLPNSLGNLVDPISVPVLTGLTPPPTASPTMSPTDSLPPSAAPSNIPTALLIETEEPSTSLAPSAAPTKAPSTPAPTVVGRPVEAFVEGITLELVNAGRLDPSETNRWEEKTAEWFTDFFNQAQRRRGINSRNLQADRVRNMSTAVIFISQNVATNGNIITYNQRLRYILEGGNLGPNEYVTLPFENDEANRAYGGMLRSEFVNMRSVSLPLQVPIISEVPPKDDGKDGLSLPIIAGIAAGGFVVIVVAAYFLFASGSKDGYQPTNSSGPPAQFNISADEDISTIGEPNVAKRTEVLPSLLEGGYGDQSVATVDYDYSKAYGGGDTSVVSSAGGTMGDTTRQTGDVPANAMALAALGAESQFREAEAGVREEVIEIIAPAGKLGVVIDTPDDGAPVVHAVKDSSVIADQIQVGDKLIAVDDEDVRSMTAIKVSKLISKKSANPQRKLTIIRTVLNDDPDG